jgi:hypothetical protein
MVNALTKTCACGCGAGFSLGTRRPAKFAVQRFASYSCAMRWRNAHADAGIIAGREKGLKAALLQRGCQVNGSGEKGGEYDYYASNGALIAPVEWLDEPLARIRAQRDAQGIRLPPTEPRVT